MLISRCGGTIKRRCDHSISAWQKISKRVVAHDTANGKVELFPILFLSRRIAVSSRRVWRCLTVDSGYNVERLNEPITGNRCTPCRLDQIGRASCRERVKMSW